MKKLILLMAISLFSISILYACGGSSAPPTESLSSPSPMSVNQSKAKPQETPTSSPYMSSGSGSSSISSPKASAGSSPRSTPVPATSVPTTPVPTTPVPATPVPATATTVSNPVLPSPTPLVSTTQPTSVANAKVQPSAIATQTPVIQSSKPVPAASFKEPNFKPLAGYVSFNEDQTLGFSRVINEEFNAAYDKIGISASVYQSGKLWSEGLGFAEESLPMEGHTPVGIKSISKTFLAALILTQIEEGFYELDDGISKLLSGHDGYESLDKSVIPDVTVRELLTMTSGIAASESNQTQEAIEVMSGPSWEPAAALKLIKREAQAPGNFEYSPIANSFLLAMIAEYKTGENLYSLYRSVLLDPLSIDAILMPDMIAPDSIAHPYGIKESYGGSGGFGDLVKIPSWNKASCPQCFDDFNFINADARIAWSGAGVVTNSQNLSLWGYELFSTHGHAISDPVREILRDSFSDQVVEFTGPKPSYGFHVAKNIFDLSDGSALVSHGHPGGGSGTSSVLFYVPDLDLSIAILANSELGSQPGNCKTAQEAMLSALDCIGQGFMEVVAGVSVTPLAEGTGPRLTIHPTIDPTNPPRIAVNNFIDLDPFIGITKLRAAYGHDFSIGDEEYDPEYKSCRSMKHYLDAYTYAQRSSGNFGSYNTSGNVKYYAPADGELRDIMTNEFSPGEIEYQFTIMSDEYPNLLFTFMHVDLLEELRNGASVKAGQHIGYVIRPHGQGEIVTWVSLGAGNIKNISFFDVMSDEVFSKYQSRGVLDREQMTITREYRDSNPKPCHSDNMGGKFIPTQEDGPGEEAFHMWQYGPDNWVFLNP